MQRQLWGDDGVRVAVSVHNTSVERPCRDVGEKPIDTLKIVFGELEQQPDAYNHMSRHDKCSLWEVYNPYIEVCLFFCYCSLNRTMHFPSMPLFDSLSRVVCYSAIVPLLCFLLPTVSFLCSLAIQELYAVSTITLRSERAMMEAGLLDMWTCCSKRSVQDGAQLAN